MTLKPEDYDAWYQTPRGRWIGAAEFALLKRMLRPEQDASLIDIGCGTGYFTRLLAKEVSGELVGIDPDEESLGFARAHAVRDERYENARGEALPFADGAFDFSVSVAALCFIPDERQAVREMLRVTKKRFAIGLLNRHSLLWRDKGRGGGKGAYQGAHWHTAAEVRALFAGLPVTNLQLRSAIVLSGGGIMARLVERLWPTRWLCGAFLCVSGEVIASA
ncbi:class I SAM-dependent methyltransferase [Prosthecobacter sp.]|uniref:class I SAM-dependent methyltransferase n=1 Tax=Prosthecobacter sp. TaxID=1965333 RepID=UPI002ABC87EF|nr:class I SAM-dependent methyltransferase [Prosthecobacter sp.]MDZ4405344.1 class I SAM-dependent methyltransferase [Prosthecobacter sp.]